MSEHQFYLDLGDVDVCLTFPSSQFAETAVHQIVLKASDHHPVIGEIRFEEDATIQSLEYPPCKPNAVYIKKEAVAEKLQKVTLRIFDLYTIVLEANGISVTVRYPGEAPASLLLDDVLQAALHWVLEDIGGCILHGSCAVRDDEAIAIMGISGAGKSTTAFNLTRLGFQCYADDAVLVVPSKDQLIVRPFTRELSIRPLTFKLLAAHGLEVADYRKEGEKYLFKPKKEAMSGALLKCVCLVEVSGENATEITCLDQAKFERALLAERKHFTFMERESAEKYATVLAHHVPIAFHAAVGTDLDRQGQAIEAVFSGADLPAAQINHRLPMQKGRKHKKEMIRCAWSHPEQPPIAKILPLLNDFDLQVLKLAFGFFQNLPMGKLEAVKKPAGGHEGAMTSEIEWLQASEWLDGCSQLVEASPVEVFQKFAYPWIKSAPLIYPFLWYYASADPEKLEHVDAAWERYIQEKQVPDQNKKSTGISLLYHLDQPWDDKKILNAIKGRENVKEIVAIPVWGIENQGLDPIIAFIQHANMNGYNARLSRLVPLCQLSQKQAQFLFDRDMFECAATRGAIIGPILSLDEAGCHSVAGGMPLREIQRKDEKLCWDEQPFAACTTCWGAALGLCEGGVSKADA